MVQQTTTSFGNFIIPGSYFDVTVKSTPVGTASSGNIVIIGEADGGAANIALDSVNGDVLKDNYYTPTQLDRVVKKYTSGPIVDAFRALASPSSDADITGSANRIYIVKTNVGTKASATVANAYGSLKDKNFGINGNKYFYQVTQSASEAAPTVTSAAITVGDGSIFNGLSFSVRNLGGTATVVTLSAVSADHDTMSELAAEINIQTIAAGIACTYSGTTLIFSAATLTDDAANILGYGRGFEIIDSTLGDLVAIGMVAGLVTASQEPEVQVNINRQDTNTNEEYIVPAEIAMTIGYLGTSATLTINSTTLSTTVSGGLGASLSIQLNQYPTLKDLADYISSQTGYHAEVIATSTQKPTSCLDQVTAIGICTSIANNMPGRIKKSLYNFVQTLSQSATLDFTATAVKGLPLKMTKVAYLSGGLKGATSAANVVTTISELEGIDVNFVVPLFSRDASADYAEGLTDTSSTYTIAAVNALVKSHVLKMSTAKLKRHRLGFCSFFGTYSQAKTQAGSLANARMSLCFQKATQVNSAGVSTSYLPWYSACVAAGMQAAGFYKAIVNKFANIISFTDPSGFDSGNPGDLEDALSAGLLFFEKGVVGNKWVSDQTTYGVDSNFVYNSIQAMYAADLVSLDLADSFQTTFVGQSLADVDAATALSYLTMKMDSYKRQKLIAASDDAPLGFKNAKVSIQGPIMNVAVEIKLATAIYFIPIEIAISAVETTA